jgi:predicted lipoprotein with Yx(FWY)xxD motif
MSLRRLCLLSAALALTACSSMMSHDSAAPATTADGVLVGPNKMTLYTFDRDTAPGKSVCNGPCATNWPPLAAGADAKAMGEWSVITRDDGTKQWAYKSRPLYYWAKDQKPGDRTGEGFNNVWHLAKP